jgi:hypothetical protein
MDMAQAVSIVDTMTNRYVNAWCFSMAYDASGKLRAVWNQHYPSILGICSGDLAGKAVSVTRLGRTVEDAEVGGYPNLVNSRDGKEWVFWQGDAFGTYEGTPEQILGSFSIGHSGPWGMPYTLSLDSQTFFNETPRATCDSAGVLWVTWSGRPKGEDSKWGIYICRQLSDGWSTPRRITSGSESGRAPDICTASDGRVWLAWHAGDGEAMRINVLRLDARTL